MLFVFVFFVACVLCLQSLQCALPMPQPLHMGNRNCTDTPGNTINIFIVKKRKYVSDCVTIEAYLQSRQGYLDSRAKKKNSQYDKVQSLSFNLSCFSSLGRIV